MKKIYESNPYCMEGQESADTIMIYEIDNEEEWWHLESFLDTDRPSEQWEEYTGLYNDYGVPAGCIFERYSFNLTGNHVIVTKTVARNV